jgi:hypothetical protein
LIAAASIAAGFGFRSPVLGMLAGALLTASISDYLFPLGFHLSDDGVGARGLLTRRRMSWSQIRGVRRDKLGVKLSPLSRRSRLEAYRGIYVWFEGNADDVMAFIAHHVTSSCCMTRLGGSCNSDAGR